MLRGSGAAYVASAFTAGDKAFLEFAGAITGGIVPDSAASRSGGGEPSDDVADTPGDDEKRTGEPSPNVAPGTNGGVSCRVGQIFGASTPIDRTSDLPSASPPSLRCSPLVWFTPVGEKSGRLLSSFPSCLTAATQVIDEFETVR